MANIISINQLIQMFKDFSNAHLFLNDFGYGPTSEIGTSRKMEFPYLWITHRSNSTINVQNKTQIPRLSLTFLIVDQINQQSNYKDVTDLNSDNQQEIISDTFQIQQDLINYMSVSMGQFGIKLVDGSITSEPVFDETDDKVTGWVMDVDLDMKHSNCVTPLGDIEFTVPAQSNISFRYLTCSTLSNCSTIQVIEDTLVTLQDEIDNLDPILGVGSGLTENLGVIDLGGLLTIDTTITGSSGIGINFVDVDDFNVSAGSNGIYMSSDADTDINAQGDINIVSNPGSINIYSPTSINIDGAVRYNTNVDVINYSLFDIDFNLGNSFEFTLEADSTLTFSNLLDGQTVILSIIQDVIGGWILTWPVGILWADGTEPVMTATASTADVYTLVVINGTIYGSYIQNFS